VVLKSYLWVGRSGGSGCCCLLRLSVALVEPKYEVNLGHVARVMANFGFHDLLLVKPEVDLGKARMFASHAVSVLDDAEICSFDDLRRFDYLVGTTAIFDVSPSNVLRSTVPPSFMAEELSRFSGSVCLVFGRDTTGLTNEELESMDMIVSIYSAPTYPTLNISHAAAILLYELSKHSFEDLEMIATEEQRNRVVRYTVNLAKSLGYAEYKLPIVETAVKQLMSKGRSSSREATLLLGLLRLANRAVKTRPATTDDDTD
jgi:tRNA/rRNA methyltransferase